MHDELFQNYPNPFNQTTQLKFSLAQRSTVKLQIYDLLGREIATLVDEQRSPGNYIETWTADRLPSGVYFCRLKTTTYSQTNKIACIK